MGSLLEGSLGLRNGIRLDLVQRLLPLRLVGRGLCSVLIVDLLVLDELLLKLGELGFQRGLLEDLSLLVGVENLGSDKLIDRLARVLA